MKYNKTYKDLSHLVEKYLISTKLNKLPEKVVDKTIYPSTFDKPSKVVSDINALFGRMLEMELLMAKINKLEIILNSPAVPSIDELDMVFERFEK